MTVSQAMPISVFASRCTSWLIFAEYVGRRLKRFLHAQGLFSNRKSAPENVASAGSRMRFERARYNRSLFCGHCDRTYQDLNQMCSYCASEFLAVLGRLRNEIGSVSSCQNRQVKTLHVCETATDATGDSVPEANFGRSRQLLVFIQN